MTYENVPFVGVINMLELRSNIVSSDTIPKKGQEVEQLVKISRTGMIIVSRYACRGKNLQLIREPTPYAGHTEDLLKSIEGYFKNYEHKDFSAENGIWTLALRNMQQDVYLYTGPMGRDMTIGAEGEDELSDMLRRVCADWDLFAFGSGRAPDMPDEILIEIEKDGNQESFYVSYEDGEMTYEFSKEGCVRSTEITVYDPEATRRVIQSVHEEMLDDTFAETRGLPESCSSGGYTYTITFTWLIAGRNEYRDGNYTLYGLPKSWPFIMNIILREWKNATPDQHIFDPSLYGRA